MLIHITSSAKCQARIEFLDNQRLVCSFCREPLASYIAEHLDPGYYTVQDNHCWAAAVILEFAGLLIILRDCRKA